MWDSIVEVFTNNNVLSFIVEFYLVFIIVFFIVRFFSKSKAALSLLIPMVLILICYFISKEFKLEVATTIFYYVQLIIVLAAVIILTPEIRQFLLGGWKKEETGAIVRTTTDSKVAIVDAVMYLSSQKIGALITIEKHRMLDQYSEKAIQMNSDISKELLINIFSPLTPLHDGAVIIKGNKIRCAGAYYVLSQRDTLDKTVGSRHRAALGIAEVTDSVTIVVSEETGSISIAYSGIFMKMSDKEQLLEYIDLVMEREV